MTHFKRPQLASAIADELIGKSSFSDAPNGLFLAAARRTGKSEFLKQDLQPALEDRGVLVVYVDLWADKKRSPMDLIASELTQAVNKSLGAVGRLAKHAGLDSINMVGVKIDTSKIGKTDGMTLHKVLSLIREQTGKTIAVIIDEAQHALTTEDGDATMSALKSARDQMRDNGQAGLLLVMSGSHRDKLMKLLNTAAAPFWGSQVRPLPTLGAPFVEQIANDLRRQRPELLGLDGAALTQAFSLCGERPQFFFGIIGDALASSADSLSFSQRVRELAQEMRERDRDGMSQIYLSLPALEQAVLWRLLDQGEGFRAFDAAALAFYAKQTGKKISTAQAQKAISNLRDNEPPLVWKSLRGEYSLYDVDMLDWYTYLNGLQAWPPKPAPRQA
jgi:hypothetical protein